MVESKVSPSTASQLVVARTDWWLAAQYLAGRGREESQHSHLTPHFSLLSPQSSLHQPKTANTSEGSVTQNTREMEQHGTS